MDEQKDDYLVLMPHGVLQLELRELSFDLPGRFTGVDNASFWIQKLREKSDRRFP
jgi:hypothetical protein